MRTPAAQKSTLNNIFDLAWVGVVGSAYAAFLGDSRRPVTGWQLAICFACGTMFAAMPFAARRFDIEATPARRTGFFITGSVLVVLALLTSGLPGSFGILPLPLVSYAAFSLPWSAALLVTLSIFGSMIATYMHVFEGATVSNTAIPYGSAYLFTVVLSVAGRHAFAARSEAERLSEELSEANARLREQADHTEELATTRERNRLAREIHDGVGHYLTVIKVQLDAAAATLASQPRTAQHSIETAARLAGEALDDVRRSVGRLRSDTPGRPLHEVIHELAAQCQPAAQFTCDGHPRPLDPAIEHALFRAAQEGLTNVRKHAHASAVTVQMIFLPEERVRLEISDDGVGPSPASGTAGGFGLTGLRERFALLAGTVELRSRTPRGCSLVVEVPA